LAEPPWSQYDQSYRRIHDRLAEILAQLSTVKDPTKYLPVRLSDGSAFYNAGGGGGSGLVQNQVRNESDTDWINEPFTRKTQTDQLPPALTTSGNLKVAVVEDLQVDVKTLPAADMSRIRWGIPREPAWINGSNQTAPTTTTDLISKTVNTGKTGRIFGWRISSPEANEFILNIGATAYRLAALGGAGLIAESHAVPVFDNAAGGTTINLRVASNGGSGKVYRVDLLFDES